MVGLPERMFCYKYFGMSYNQYMQYIIDKFIEFNNSGAFVDKF